MNVALHLNAIGLDATIASSVGNDEPGAELKKFLEDSGMSTAYIQTDDNLPTSEVLVHLDENNNANRPEAVKILSQPNYVGADYNVIANSMTGTFEYEKGDKRSVPDFNVFFRHNATYPYYSDAIWYLTQMRRWGQIPEQKPDSWYMDIAKKVYRPDIYAEAAQALIEEGLMDAKDFPNFSSEDGFRAPQTHFIDGITYDGKKPNEYLTKFNIGLKNDEKI